MMRRHARALDRALIAIALVIAFAAGAATGGGSARAPAAAASTDSMASAPAERDGRAAPLGIGAYRAQVTRVLDGDTVEARIAIWLGQEATTLVRLRGVDAPEIAGACAGERDLALASKAALEAMIGSGAVTIDQITRDKFGGRIVGRLATPRDPDVGAALIRAGLARAYGGRKRDAWCAASR